MNIKNKIRIIPDFPIEGIQFKDITPLLLDYKSMNCVLDAVIDKFMDCGITKVVGIESRGFIFGPMIATCLNAGFVPARKPGKLPAETVSITYQKEYGKDTIEIHKDAITADDVVLIHDDVLATGGTIEATVKLLKSIGVKKIYVNCLVSIPELEGWKKFKDDVICTYIVDE